MSYQDEEYERRKRAIEERKRVRSAGRPAQGAGTGTTLQSRPQMQSSQVRRTQSSQLNRRSLGTDPYDRPVQPRQAAPNRQAAPTRQTASTRQAQAGRAAEPVVRQNVRRAPEPEQPMRNQHTKKQLSPKQKKKRRNRAIIFTIEGILLVLVLALVFVLSKWDLIQKASFGKKDVYVSELSDNVIQSMEGYRNIAIFGIDENGSHSDVIMIASVNNATGEATLTSILRDTYWNAPNGRTGQEDYYAKANSAYHNGGSLNALKALNKNLDLNITEFVEVNWVSVAKTVDILGGLDIDVPETMMGEINGYITNCVEETGYPSTHLKHSGMQHLQGMQVVAYCRIRHHNGGDDGRASRQREVVGMLLERVKQVNPEIVLELCDAVFPDITTNLTLANIISMIPQVKDYNIVSMEAFPYHQKDANVDNASVKVPLGLADDVTTLHQKLFNDYNYAPSDVVKAISNHIENYTGYSIDDR